MWERQFLKRLRRELPDWVAAGWVAPEHAPAILDHAAARADSSQRWPTIIAVLGAILVAIGAITFIASNWAALSKAVRLAIPTVAMWVAYGGGYALIRAGWAPRAGRALLLLGALLFGATIMLIGQIYNVEADPPGFVLLWAVGTVLAGALLREQPIMVVAVALAALWTALETIDREAVHWLFPPAWLVILALVLFWRWRIGAVMAVLALAVWIGFALGASWTTGLPVPLHTGAAIGFAGLAVGGLAATWWATTLLAAPLRVTSLLAALACLSLLAIPDVHESSRAAAALAAVAPGRLLVAGAGATALAALVWRHRRQALARDQLWLAVGAGLLIAFLWIDLGAAGGSRFTLAVILNIGLVGLLIALAAVGTAVHDRLLINAGLGFLAVNLVRLYFDSFWDLLDRSIYFTVGGVVILAVGIVLERYRRRLSAAAGSAKPS